MIPRPPVEVYYSVSRFERSLVRHGVQVRVGLRKEFPRLEHPEVMADKGRKLWAALASRLWVKQVASADESSWLPPVAVHAVNRCRAILAIHSDSLVDALLVTAQVIEGESHVLVVTLDNLHRVSIDLTH